MNINFLVEWDNETVQIRVVDGPFPDDMKEAKGAQTTEDRYCPISTEQFMTAISALLPGSTQKTIENWITFAKECIEQGQYVDFTAIPNQMEAVGRWLETIVTSLYLCRIQYGVEIAVKVFNLGQLEKPMCLYPDEMQKAALHLMHGGDAEAISEIIQDGGFESATPYFPKIRKYRKLYVIFGSNRDDRD